MRIWRIVDSRTGHGRQSAALVDAIRALPGLEALGVEDVPATRSLRATLRAARAARPVCAIGAGHATHSRLVALRLLTGTPTIVLMRPSLPYGLFSRCIVPEHDAPPARGNIIPTLGALAPKPPPSLREAGLGLVLLGGDSKHFVFDPGEIEAQISALIANASAERWVIADSRRTPKGLLTKLEDRFADVPGIAFMHAQDSGPDWLPEMLGRARQVWVSPDSLSMVFEALTAGVAVGLFNLTPKRQTRVVRAMEGLRARGYVGTPGNGLPAGQKALDEAGRVARLLAADNFFGRGMRT